MPDLVRVRTALLSVSDKAQLEPFARALVAQGVRLISTGGTARFLLAAGLPVEPVERLTGFPEMMDGRVKTLHPAIHGGLLALRDEPEHAASLARHAIAPIDLLCVNLYPFRETVARPGVTLDEAVEQIDIGGPAMVRSAAKNHAHVAVLTSPTQYAPVLAEMEVTDGCTSLPLREQLASAAFALTATYDQAIAAYLRQTMPSGREKPGRAASAAPSGPHARRTPVPPAAISEPPASDPTSAPTSAPAAMHPTGPDRGDPDRRFPVELDLAYTLVAPLRYGENPHQAAAVYRDDAFAGASVVTAQQVHGRELSYNNLADAAAALELARALGRAEVSPLIEGPWPHAAAAIIKHANPCGAAVAPSLAQAVDRAIAGDPLAAYGGILAVSTPLDLPAAQRLSRTDVFLEVIVAPRVEPAALEVLKAKSTQVRVLVTGERPEEGRAAGGRPARAPLVHRAIAGGLLVQEADVLPPTPRAWAVKAGAPTDTDRLAGAVIEIVVRAMNSNAVGIGGIDPEFPRCIRLFGAGLGQVDRVSACRLAVQKAGPLARGAVAVSDAFFPFPDGPALLLEAGVRTIIHPGGSKRDEETFGLIDRSGAACLVTGVRRFRH